LIKDLLETGGIPGKKSSAKTGEEVAERLMKDDRFGRLFTDKDF
jgi:hypothetical protein